jgi:hypothetical protein
MGHFRKQQYRMKETIGGLNTSQLSKMVKKKVSQMQSWIQIGIEAALRHAWHPLSVTSPLGIKKGKREHFNIPFQEPSCSVRIGTAGSSATLERQQHAACRPVRRVP